MTRTRRKILKQLLLLKSVGLMGLPKAFGSSPISASSMVHRSVRYSFTLKYPENRSMDDIQSDLSRIFPSFKASLVDQVFLKAGLAWDKVVESTPNYHMMTITFKDQITYYNWEAQLRLYSTYDKSLFKSLGYSFETTKVS